MLRQRTAEEKRLWKALSESSPRPLSVSPIGTDVEIRRIENALRREFWNMTWWRYPLATFMIVSSVVLATANTIEALAGKFSENLPLLLIKIIVPLLSGTLLLLYIKPSTRWKNGIFAILELSKQASANESVRALLYIARMDYFWISMNIPELYERLTQVLTHVTDFTPDWKEQVFLMRVVRNPRRYPDSLRTIALLILGDRQLGYFFLTGLKRMLRKEINDAFLAAARDVLSRK